MYYMYIHTDKYLSYLKYTSTWDEVGRNKTAQIYIPPHQIRQVGIHVKLHKVN